MLTAGRRLHLHLASCLDSARRTMSLKKRVCVAVDSSDCSAEALKWATSAVLQPEDELLIVNVVQPTTSLSSPPGDPSVPWLKPPPEAVQASQELVASLATQAEKMGICNVRTCVVEAPIGSSEGVGLTLKEISRMERPDMLVIGSRGLGSMARALLGVVGLGSVSSFCVHEVPCPVLVHKAGSTWHAGTNSNGGGSKTGGSAGGGTATAAADTSGSSSNPK